MQMFPPENDFEMMYGSEAVERIGDSGMLTDEEKIDEAVEKQVAPEMVSSKLETAYGPAPVSYSPKEKPGIVARWRDKIETSIFSLYSPSYKNAFLRATIGGKGEEQAKADALSAMVTEAVDKGGIDTAIAQDAVRGMKYYGAKSGFDSICNNSILKVLFAPVCIIISLVKTVIYIIIAIIGIIAFIAILKLVITMRKDAKRDKIDEQDRADKKRMLQQAIDAKSKS